MTKCKILKRLPISLDGISVTYWGPDEVRDVPDDLMPALVDAGAVEIVEDKPKRQVKKK